MSFETSLKSNNYLIVIASRLVNKQHWRLSYT